jgi:hypothetical protein
MRSGWRITAVGLLFASIVGCAHKPPKTAPPPAAQAPSRPPAEMAQQIPPMPGVPSTEQPPVKLDTAIPPEPANETAEQHPHHTRRHPKTTDAAQQDAKPAVAPETTPANPDVASGPPSDISPLGQLSTANNANIADRQALTDQINVTEYNLNGIHRSLSSDGQKTAALIRTFITKARQALKTDDLDGARLFTTKAKILLQELTKE